MLGCPKSLSFQSWFGHDRTLIRYGVLSRQEKRTIHRKRGRDRIERPSAVLSRQRFRVLFCGARSAAVQHGSKTPTNILIINVLHISFYPRRNRKKDVTRRVYMPRNPFRQTGARRHAFCIVMRKVSVRQLPKSAYGAQLHEIYR